MIDSPAGTPLAGCVRFVRYAFMPNRLRYCGGDDNRTLFEYGIESAVDGGLSPLVRKFSGALPYLRLIARVNNIADPFDARVVDTYWLGNALLDGVEVRQLYDHLRDRFGKQLQGRTRELVVDRAPLLLELGKLVLGEPQPTRVVRQVDGRGFADAARVGDWVSALGRRGSPRAPPYAPAQKALAYSCSRQVEIRSSATPACESVAHPTPAEPRTCEPAARDLP